MRAVKNWKADSDPWWFDHEWEWEHSFNAEKTVLSLQGYRNGVSDGLVTIHPIDEDSWLITYRQGAPTRTREIVDVRVLKFLFGLAHPNTVREYLDTGTAFNVNAEYYVRNAALVTGNRVMLLTPALPKRSWKSENVAFEVTAEIKQAVAEFIKKVERF